MNIYALTLALTIYSACPAHSWPFDQDFFPTDNMRAFLEEQKSKVEKVIYAGYDQARKMKDSVNSYVEEQQRKISNDVNSYMETVKDSGRRVGDSWSYLPSEDPTAKMENPDVVLTVPSMIVRHGYTCETHSVVSQGYVLSIHRIPRAKHGGEVTKKTVLLHHGLFASSADWIINGPEKGLAYVLADAGYDVWMANIRGNRYSREHTSLKIDSKSYWNFSWHDVALHDVPAIIDYIRNTKPGAKITYIGHSMGTTILFAMLTLRPEYNEILSSGVALAPVVFNADMKSPLKSVAPITSNVAYMEMLYGSHEFIPKQSSLGRISSSCEVGKTDFVVCKNLIFYICGYDEKQLNQTLLPVFLSHLGTGTSWKTAVHFAQEIVSGGKFQQFDYGTYHNQRMYGSDSPPEYDLSKITLPLSLFWAQNDLLSSEKDVLKLYESLPQSSTELYMVPDPEFNHVDYLWAVDANKLINEKLLDTLRKTHENTSSTKFHLGFK